MCPDCVAVSEQMGVLKERLLEQQKQLVRYDAMLSEGKLRALGPLPHNGVCAMTTIEAREPLPGPSLQRALHSEGRAAVYRLIANATERLRMQILAEIAPRIRFAEPRADLVTGETHVVAWLNIDSSAP